MRAPGARNAAFDALVQQRRPIAPDNYQDVSGQLTEEGAPLAFVVNAIVAAHEVDRLPEVVQAIRDNLAPGTPIAIMVGVNTMTTEVTSTLTDAVTAAAAVAADLDIPIAVNGYAVGDRGPGAFPYGRARNAILHDPDHRAVIEAFATTHYPYVSVQDFDTGARTTTQGQHIFNRFEELTGDDDGPPVRPVMFTGGYRVDDRQQLRADTLRRLQKIDPSGLDARSKRNFEEGLATLEDDEKADAFLDDFSRQINDDMATRDRQATIYPTLPYAPEPNLFVDGLLVLGDNDVRFGDSGAEFLRLSDGLQRAYGRELAHCYGADSLAELSPEIRDGSLQVDAQNNRHPIRGNTFVADFTGSAAPTDLSRLALAYLLKQGLPQSHANMMSVGRRLFASEGTPAPNEGTSLSNYPETLKPPAPGRNGGKTGKADAPQFGPGTPFAAPVDAGSTNPGWEQSLTDQQRRWLGGRDHNVLNPALSDDAGIGLPANQKLVAAHLLATSPLEHTLQQEFAAAAAVLDHDTVELHPGSIYSAVAAALDTNPDPSQLRADTVRKGREAHVKLIDALSNHRRDNPYANGHFVTAVLAPPHRGRPDPAEQSENLAAHHVVAATAATGTSVTIVVHHPDATTTTHSPINSRSRATVHINQTIDAHGAINYQPHISTTQSQTATQTDPARRDWNNDIKREAFRLVPSRPELINFNDQHAEALTRLAFATQQPGQAPMLTPHELELLRQNPQEITDKPQRRERRLAMNRAIDAVRTFDPTLLDFGGRLGPLIKLALTKQAELAGPASGDLTLIDRDAAGTREMYEAAWSAFDREALTRSPSLPVTALTEPSTPDERIVARHFPWLPRVNPYRDWGGEFTTNCVLAAITTDIALDEQAPFQAPPSAATPARDLLNYQGDPPITVRSFDDVREKLATSPVGARGFVVVRRDDDEIAHAFNIVHHEEGVFFLDGQTGKLADTSFTPHEITLIPTAGLTPGPVARVREFLAGPDAPAFAVYIDKALNTGHIMAAMMMINSLRATAGGRGDLVVMLNDDVRAVMDRLTPHGIDAYARENGLTLVPHREFDVNDLTPGPRLDGPDGRPRLVLVAGIDTVDSDYSTEFLNHIGTDHALVMQPHAWQSGDRMLLHRDGPDDQVVKIDLAAGDNPVDEFTTFRYAIPPGTTTEVIDDSKLSDQRKAGLRSVVDAVGRGHADLMPAYGLHRLEPVQRAAAPVSVAHALHESRAAAKASIVLLAGDVDPGFTVPAPDEDWIVQAKLDDPELPRIIDGLRPGDVLLLRAGGLPNNVFTRMFGEGTLPALIEGANSANLALQLRRPYFFVRSGQYEGISGGTSEATRYPVRDGDLADVTPLVSLTDQLVKPTGWGEEILQTRAGDLQAIGRAREAVSVLRTLTSLPAEERKFGPDELDQVRKLADELSPEAGQTFLDELDEKLTSYFDASDLNRLTTFDRNKSRYFYDLEQLAIDTQAAAAAISVDQLNELTALVTAQLRPHLDNLGAPTTSPMDPDPDDIHNIATMLDRVSDPESTESGYFRRIFDQAASPANDTLIQSLDRFITQSQTATQTDPARRDWNNDIKREAFRLVPSRPELINFNDQHAEALTRLAFATQQPGQAPMLTPHELELLRQNPQEITDKPQRLQRRLAMNRAIDAVRTFDPTLLDFGGRLGPLIKLALTKQAELAGLAVLNRDAGSAPLWARPQPRHDPLIDPGADAVPWQDEKLLGEWRHALDGPRVRRATRWREEAFSLAREHTDGGQQLGPDLYLDLVEQVAVHAAIEQILAESGREDVRRSMAGWANGLGHRTAAERQELVVLGEIGAMTSVLAERAAEIEAAGERARAEAAVAMRAGRIVPDELPDSLRTAATNSERIARELAVYQGAGPSLQRYAEGLRAGIRVGDTTVVPTPPVNGDGPYAGLVSAVREAIAVQGVEAPTETEDLLTELETAGLDPAALAERTGLQIFALEMTADAMTEAEAVAAFEFHGPVEGPRVVVVRHEDAWKVLVEDAPQPEPERAEVPWHAEDGGLGEFGISRVTWRDPAESARRLANRLRWNEGVPWAGESAAIADRVRAEIETMLAHGDQRTGDGADEVYAHWEKLLLEGVTVPVNDRLVWIRPRPRRFAVSNPQPERNGRYGVSFASTSLDTTTVRSRGKSLVDLGAELLFTGATEAFSRFLLGLPQLGLNTSRGGSTSESLKVISGRKLFAKNFVDFTAGLSFEVSVDGDAPIDLAVPPRDGTLGIRFPREFVTSPRRPSDEPRQPTAAPGPATAPAAGSRETINAVDVAPVVRAIHRELQARTDLPAEARSAIASRITADVLNERALRNRSIAALSNGIVMDMVLAGELSVRPRIRLEPTRLQYLPGATTPEVTIREDKGLLRGTKETSERGVEGSAGLGAILRGLTASPGLPLRGSLTIGPEGATGSGTKTSLDVKTGGHAVTVTRDAQHRYRADFTGHVEFLGDARVGTVTAPVTGELGVLDRDRVSFEQRNFGRALTETDTAPIAMAAPSPVELSAPLTEADLDREFGVPSALAPHFRGGAGPRTAVADVPRVLAEGRGHAEAMETRWPGIERVLPGVREMLTDAARPVHGSAEEWAKVDQVLEAAYGKGALEAEPDRVWAGAQQRFTVGGQTFHVVVQAHPGPLDEATPDPVNANTRAMRGPTVAGSTSTSWRGGVSVGGQARSGGDLRLTAEATAEIAYESSAEESVTQARKDYFRSEFDVSRTVRIPTRLTIAVSLADGPPVTRELRGDIAEYVSVPRFYDGSTATPGASVETQTAEQWAALDRTQVPFAAHGVSGVRPFFGNLPELSATVARLAGVDSNPMTWPEPIRRLGEAGELAAAFRDLTESRGWEVSLGGDTKAVITMRVHDVQASPRDHDGEIEKYSQQLGKSGGGSKQGWSYGGSGGFAGQFRPGHEDSGQADEDDLHGNRVAFGGRFGLGWSNSHSRGEQNGMINISRETARGHHHRASASFEVRVVHGASDAGEPIRLRADEILSFLAEPRLAARLGLPGAGAPPADVVTRQVVDRDLVRALTHVEHLAASRVLDDIVATAEAWGVLPDSLLSSQLNEMFRDGRLEDAHFDLFGSGVRSWLPVLGGPFTGYLTVEVKARPRPNGVRSAHDIDDDVDATFRAEGVHETSDEHGEGSGKNLSGQMRYRYLGDEAGGGTAPAGGISSGDNSSHGTEWTAKTIARLTTRSKRMTEFVEDADVELTMSFTSAPRELVESLRTQFPGLRRWTGEGTPGLGVLRHTNTVPASVRYVVPTTLTTAVGAVANAADAGRPANYNVSLLDAAGFQPLTFPAADDVARLVTDVRGVSESLLRPHLDELLSPEGYRVGQDIVRVVVDNVHAVRGADGQPLKDKFKWRAYEQSAGAPKETTGTADGWNVKLPGDGARAVSKPTDPTATYLGKLGGSAGLAHEQESGAEQSSELSTTIERNKEVTGDYFYLTAAVTVTVTAPDGSVRSATRPGGLTMVNDQNAAALNPAPATDTPAQGPAAPASLLSRLRSRLAALSAGATRLAPRPTEDIELTVLAPAGTDLEAVATLQRAEADPGHVTVIGRSTPEGIIQDGTLVPVEELADRLRPAGGRPVVLVADAAIGLAAELSARLPGVAVAAPTAAVWATPSGEVFTTDLRPGVSPVPHMPATGTWEAVRTPTPEEIVQRDYPWLPRVNPYRDRDTEAGTNCLLVALTTDIALATGEGWIAPQSEDQPAEDLLNYRGDPEIPAHDFDEIRARMAAAPVGARGMVVVRVGTGEIGHVFNVVHHLDGVVFLDGQTGRPADTSLTDYRCTLVPTTNLGGEALGGESGLLSGDFRLGSATATSPTLPGGWNDYEPAAPEQENLSDADDREMPGEWPERDDEPARTDEQAETEVEEEHEEPEPPHDLATTLRALGFPVAEPDPKRQAVLDGFGAVLLTISADRLAALTVELSRRGAHPDLLTAAQAVSYRRVAMSHPGGRHEYRREQARRIDRLSRDPREQITVEIVRQRLDLISEEQGRYHLLELLDEYRGTPAARVPQLQNDYLAELKRRAQNPALREFEAFLDEQIARAEAAGFDTAELEQARRELNANEQELFVDQVLYEIRRRGADHIRKTYHQLETTLTDMTKVHETYQAYPDSLEKQAVLRRLEADSKRHVQQYDLHEPRYRVLTSAYLRPRVATAEQHYKRIAALRGALPPEAPVTEPEDQRNLWRALTPVQDPGVNDRSIFQAILVSARVQDVPLPEWASSRAHLRQGVAERFDPAQLPVTRGGEQLIEDTIQAGRRGPSDAEILRRGAQPGTTNVQLVREALTSRPALTTTVLANDVLHVLAAALYTTIVVVDSHGEGPPEVYGAGSPRKLYINREGVEYFGLSGSDPSALPNVSLPGAEMWRGQAIDTFKAGLYGMSHAQLSMLATVHRDSRRQLAALNEMMELARIVELPGSFVQHRTTLREQLAQTEQALRDAHEQAARTLIRNLDRDRRDLTAQLAGLNHRGDLLTLHALTRLADPSDPGWEDLTRLQLLAILTHLTAIIYHLEAADGPSPQHLKALRDQVRARMGSPDPDELPPDVLWADPDAVREVQDWNLPGAWETRPEPEPEPEPEPDEEEPPHDLASTLRALGFAVAEPEARRRAVLDGFGAALLTVPTDRLVELPIELADRGADPHLIAVARTANHRRAAMNHPGGPQQYRREIADRIAGMERDARRNPLLRDDVELLRERLAQVEPIPGRYTNLEMLAEYRGTPLARLPLTEREYQAELDRRAKTPGLGGFARFLDEQIGLARAGGFDASALEQARHEVRDNEQEVFVTKVLAEIRFGGTDRIRRNYQQSVETLGNIGVVRKREETRSDSLERGAILDLLAENELPFVTTRKHYEPRYRLIESEYYRPRVAAADKLYHRAHAVVARGRADEVTPEVPEDDDPIPGGWVPDAPPAEDQVRLRHAFNPLYVPDDARSIVHAVTLSADAQGVPLPDWAQTSDIEELRREVLIRFELDQLPAIRTGEQLIYDTIRAGRRGPGDLEVLRQGTEPGLTNAQIIGQALTRTPALAESVVGDDLMHVLAKTLDTTIVVVEDQTTGTAPVINPDAPRKIYVKRVYGNQFVPLTTGPGDGVEAPHADLWQGQAIDTFKARLYGISHAQLSRLATQFRLAPRRLAAINDMTEITRIAELPGSIHEHRAALRTRLEETERELDAQAAGDSAALPPAFARSLREDADDLRIRLGRLDHRADLLALHALTNLTDPDDPGWDALTTLQLIYISNHLTTLVVDLAAGDAGVPSEILAMQDLVGERLRGRSTGTVKVVIADPDDQATLAAAENFPIPPGHYTVVAHVTLDGLTVAPDELARRILDDPEFHGQPVTIAASYAGIPGGFAEQLSRHLPGVTVRGPDGSLWSTAFEAFVTPELAYTPDGRPQLPPAGTWKTYTDAVRTAETGPYLSGAPAEDPATPAMEPAFRRSDPTVGFSA